MNTRFCPECRRNYGNLSRCPLDATKLVRLPSHYPAPGTVIDDEYELQSPVAAGGMSRIYRAARRSTAEPIAVKVLDPRLAAHPYTIERFYREARVAQLLDHPAVVTVEEYGPTASGHHAIMMEFLGGESVGSALRREARLPWERAVHIVIELCDALGHAHGRRVVHRDVKPENVQLFGDLGPDERVKLLDFGVAYVSVDASFSRPAPGSTNVSGTPAYMSPEQIRGLPLDGRSDVYALGVLFFEMLSGQRPFLGDDPVEVCRKQLFDRPPSLGNVLPQSVRVPPELQTILVEMLQKSPRSRVAGVGALLGRLLPLLPKERWPTRLRRRMVGATQQPMWQAPRRPTAEILWRPQRASVLMLQLTIDYPSQGHHGAAAWPVEIDALLAGWRALVEEGGGLILQPEPDTMRAIFGLFRPSRRSADLWSCVQHALRLRDLITEHSPHRGACVRGCAMRVEMVDPHGAASGVDDGLPQRDSLIASALQREAPPGGLVMTDSLKEALEPYCSFKPLGFIEDPDIGAEALTVYLVGEPRESDPDALFGSD